MSHCRAVLPSQTAKGQSLMASTKGRQMLPLRIRNHDITVLSPTLTLEFGRDLGVENQHHLAIAGVYASIQLLDSDLLRCKSLQLIHINMNDDIPTCISTAGRRYVLRSFRSTGPASISRQYRRSLSLRQLANGR